MNYDPVVTGDCNTKTDDQGATGVWLERTADGLALVADSEDICIISDDLADRSKCLVTARAASSVGDQVPLALDKRLLLLWHSFASGLDSVYTMDVQDLCNAVKAADFLDDQETLLQASAATAERAFPMHMAAPNTSRSAAPQERAHSCARSQPDADRAAAHAVVGSLPEHLLLPVLSAALRSMPPTVNMADATNAQYALKALIARLPERLHPLALQAHDPDVVHRRSFSALLADTPSAAAITEALSRACASHLTSLSLSCSMLPAGVHPIYDSAIDRRDFYVQAALQATFAPVASLTALRELQFVVFSHPRMLRDFLSQEVPAALAPALAQLTSLTSLTVRCHTHNGAAVGEVAACLPALRALRALDLSHCGAKPLHGADAPLQRLADALPAVTAVTHLCLTGNPLGNRGWEGLAAAAAALPLQALDLCSCCLCGEWDLCGGVPPDPDAPRPFAALRSLGLSNNVIDRVGAVTAQTVPQLTRVALVLPHSLRGAPVHAQALEAVAAAATPPLEVLCVGPLLEDLQLELAGDCLERCRRLRSVSLSWATHTSAALPRIFRNLFSLPWLQEVSLECAEVTPDVAAISQCTRLSHLALRHVVCAAQNSHLLTSMLAPLGLLRCLHVDVRGSADNAAVDAVALGVRTLTLLTKLHLIHSGMRPDLLAEALTGLTGLEHLELGDHPLWAAGVTAVAEVSRRMHHMAFLALGLGQGEEGLPALVAALPMMRGLRRLRVAGVGESGRAAVLQALPPGVESVQT